ncbi:MAG: hypothetical protein EOP04_20715 [Proteobacteria bacterium]|nr:MAG: hypothetical protein EOP04_20715 [Pseudomonadota bacterium]
MEELSDIHKTLNHLEPIESEEEKFRPVKSLFYFPLAVSFILSLFWALFSLLRHAGSPQKTGSPNAKGVAP